MLFQHTRGKRVYIAQVTVSMQLIIAVCQDIPMWSFQVGDVLAVKTGKRISFDGRLRTLSLSSLSSCTAAAIPLLFSLATWSVIRENGGETTSLFSSEKVNSGSTWKTRDFSWPVGMLRKTFWPSSKRVKSFFCSSLMLSYLKYAQTTQWTSPPRLEFFCQSFHSTIYCVYRCNCNIYTSIYSQLNGSV